MTDEEKEKWIKTIEKMKALYPGDELLIINPKTHLGYNLENGKGIRLVTEEYDVDF